MEKRYFPPFSWIFAVALVLALAVLGIGIFMVATSPDTGGWVMLAAGCVSIVAVFITWPLSLTVHASRATGRKDVEEVIQGIAERLDQMSILMNLMSEQQLLSDRAKSIAFRDKDREALRRAISEEINKGDWDAAWALTEEIERSFGNKVEADRYRDDIRRRRQEIVARQVSEAMVVIDRHTKTEQWNAALREAERLMGLYPNEDRVRNLPQEIERRRQDHKRRLLESWNDAVARHDVDGSIEILKQLDTYLTPAEAESMQDTARSVFKEKLNNLGKQFGSAVQDHKWADAIRIGDSIIREFPNSRIAQEVREKMDLLRQRAAEHGGAAPAGAAPATA